MKIKLVRSSRYPNFPLFAVIIVFVWLAFVCLATYINFKLDKFVDLCLFKRMTGYPCPTCGTTRGVLSLMQGKFLEAWLFNPMVFIIALFIFFNLLFKFIFAKKIKISFTKKEKKIAWLIAAILFFANWAYIIFYIG